MRVPKEAEVQQVVPALNHQMTINVPSWELAGLKAMQEEAETKRRELARLKADQEEEFARLKADREKAKRRQEERTSLVGAV